MVKVRVAGVPVELDGVTYIVPPLTFRMLEAHQQDLDMVQNETIEDALGIERLNAAARLAHAALSRNYDLELDEILDKIDLGNIVVLIEAVLAVSGLARTREVDPPGET